MQDLRHLIPVPGSLFVFEAAGRLGSFTRAAEELKVTQAAVSYAIRRLEETLGVALFERRHRKVVLTEVGERFYNDVAIGLAHIRRSAEEIQGALRQGHVTLSASTAFASFWMLPRLAAFRSVHPDIDLRLQTTDKDVDIAGEGIALGIRRGDGEWSRYEAALLARETLYPVSSPELLSSLPAGGFDTADLSALPLIHLEEPFRPRPTWEDFFAALGASYEDHGEGLRLNDYALVLQAALEGQGIALGWDHLVAPLCARGKLAKIGEASWTTDQAHYLVWAKGRPLSAEACAVRDWLLREAGTSG